jgi:hypothetical protein
MKRALKFLGYVLVAVYFVVDVVFGAGLIP